MNCGMKIGKVDDKTVAYLQVSMEMYCPFSQQLGFNLFRSRNFIATVV